MLEEERYKKQVGVDHLRRFGQYFTPYPLARLMASWVNHIEPETVLDPAAGNHVFARSLLELGSSAHVVGFEVDPVIANAFPPPHNTRIVHEDFLLSSWAEKFDGIIANPPYMKFQLIENREAIRENFLNNHQRVPNWQSNLYVLFLLKALRQLKAGGRMIFLVPHDFLDSKSGELVKSELVLSSYLEAVISLEHFDGEIFPDALTSSCLLKISNQSNSAVLFSHPKSIPELELAVTGAGFGYEVVHNELAVKEKWRPYFMGRKVAKSDCCLGDFADVKRGIATGANEFFVLSPSEARSLGISDSELSNVLSKSVLVKGHEFSEAHMEQLMSSDAKCKLFTPQHDLSASARAYVRSGEEAGWHKKYLCAARKEWFRTEVKEPAPIWVSQASRGRIRVVRNRSKALNLTTFHGLWPSEHLGLTADALFAVLMSKVGQESLLRSSKRMANGLLKIQPGDLKSTKLPNLLKPPEVLVELDRLGARLGSVAGDQLQELGEIDYLISQLR